MSDFKKNFVYPFISKLYRLLREEPDIFVFEKMKETLGECNWETIKINPYHPDCNIVSVLIHEGLHWFYPKWPEKKVLKYEQRVLESLSSVQLKRLNISLLDCF